MSGRRSVLYYALSGWLCSLASAGNVCLAKPNHGFSECQQPRAIFFSCRRRRPPRQPSLCSRWMRCRFVKTKTTALHGSAESQAQRGLQRISDICNATCIPLLRCIRCIKLEAMRRMGSRGRRDKVRAPFRGATRQTARTCANFSARDGGTANPVECHAAEEPRAVADADAAFAIARRVKRIARPAIPSMTPIRRCARSRRHGVAPAACLERGVQWLVRGTRCSPARRKRYRHARHRSAAHRPAPRAGRRCLPMAITDRSRAAPGAHAGQSPGAPRRWRGAGVHARMHECRQRIAGSRSGAAKKTGRTWRPVGQLGARRPSGRPLPAARRSRPAGSVR